MPIIVKSVKAAHTKRDLACPTSKVGTGGLARIVVLPPGGLPLYLRVVDDVSTPKTELDAGLFTTDNPVLLREKSERGQLKFLRDIGASTSFACRRVAMVVAGRLTWRWWGGCGCS